jgi:2-amino-4-hydroxy-6-hydroxymethyldihydropteridine diphosphokinase
MARCLVGCGSNVGGRRDFLDRAMELLRFMPGVKVVGVSRYRDTRPIGGPPGQDRFLNGACLLETDLPPHDVLGMLAAVENTLHRERAERWGPRTVDLDLLLYDDLVLESESLTLPHPRMATRRFVLEPCVEIAPEVVHPVAACSLDRLLESISASHPHVAVAGIPGSGAAEIAAAVADATMARLLRGPAGFPLPADPADERLWEDLLVAAAAPLAPARWPRDAHGAIADFWLPSLVLEAREHLAEAPLRRFEARCVRTAADMVPPHVVLLLRVSPAAIEERLAFRDRHGGETSDVFAGIAPAAATAAPADRVERLMAAQRRLEEAVRHPGHPLDPGPRAIITIAADDLAAAIDEGVAAVEAMA